MLYHRYALAWDQLPMFPEASPQRGAPQWPHGFVGSISHCQDLAVAALAPCSHLSGMGIDVEQILSEEKTQRLRSHILHPAEHWVTTPLDLSLVFSFKESIYKALHPFLQRFIGFQEVQVHSPLALNAVTVRLSWTPERALAQDLQRHFNGAPPTFTGKGQWWGKNNPTHVFTQYYFIMRLTSFGDFCAGAKNKNKKSPILRPIP